MPQAAAARKQELEGVIAKRRSSRYEPVKRSRRMMKMRINKGQELVIVGYVPAAREQFLEIVSVSAFYRLSHYIDPALDDGSG